MFPIPFAQRVWKPPHRTKPPQSSRQPVVPTRSASLQNARLSGCDLEGVDLAGAERGERTGIGDGVVGINKFLLNSYCY